MQHYHTLSHLALASAILFATLKRRTSINATLLHFSASDGQKCHSVGAYKYALRAWEGCNTMALFRIGCPKVPYSLRNSFRITQHCDTFSHWLAESAILSAQQLQNNAILWHFSAWGAQKCNSVCKSETLPLNKCNTMALSRIWWPQVR